jgi:serine/threonine protein phosphatase 1
VIGDVHGRLDLLDQLLEQIHGELDQRPAAKTLLVFVGDLVDRGPSSAQVLERLRTYDRPGVTPVFLLGNHEEVLLRILGGDSSPIGSWLKFGGAQCLASYGADADVLSRGDDKEMLAAVLAAIPGEHVDFLNSFADTCRFGDYLFVHAGIRPGVEVDLQAQADLRWIRAPFLLDDSDHGFVVVHGHTITKEVDERANRICIDTGAYRSGILTALAIEDERRWFLDTAAVPTDPVH